VYTIYSREEFDRVMRYDFYPLSVDVCNGGNVEASIETDTCRKWEVVDPSDPDYLVVLSLMGI